MDCWFDAGEIKGTSNLTPSAWTNETLAEDSLNKLDKQFIAKGIEQVGWDGFFSWKENTIFSKDQHIGRFWSYHYLVSSDILEVPKLGNRST